MGGLSRETIRINFPPLFSSIFLARKFKMDRGRVYLSSLFCSGQIMREEALKELEKPPY